MEVGRRAAGEIDSRCATGGHFISVGAVLPSALTGLSDDRHFDLETRREAVRRKTKAVALSAITRTVGYNRNRCFGYFFHALLALPS